MAVDVSKIPNNNKFDPVRQAILDLEREISSGVAGVASINNVSGAVTLTGLSPIIVSSNASTSQITVGVNLSVTQNTASGIGTLTYNNGVFTYTPPDLSSFLTDEVNDLTAAVTWANVPDANITQSSVTQHQAALSITESQISDLGNYLDLDNTGEQTIAGGIVISGDLTVSGTTTYINTTNLNVGDNIITLNADLPSGTAPTENAGIEINRGSATDKTFLWDETADKWTLGSETLIAGTFEGNLTGNVTGDLTGNADTATNADKVDGKHATDFNLEYVTDNGATTTNSITISSAFDREFKIDQTDSSSIRLGVTNGTKESFIIADNTGTNHQTGDAELKILTTETDGTSGVRAKFNATGLGLGVDPSYKFDLLVGNPITGRFKSSSVSGAEVIIDNGYTNNVRLGLKAASTGTFIDSKNATGTSVQPMYFQIASSSKMTIATDGDVGINTTLPDEKLHVVGNVKADSFIKDGGTSSEFLKADGSVDTNTYLTTASIDLQDVTDNGATTTRTIQVGGVKTDLIQSASQASESFIDLDDDLWFAGATTNVLTLSSKSHMVFVNDTNSNGTTENFSFYTQGTTDATATKLFEIQQAGNVVSYGTYVRSQYDSTHYAQLESNSSGGVVKGVGGNGFLIRSYGDTYFNGGDVGIGTTSPDRNLHVYGTSGQILLESSTANFPAGVELKTTTREWDIFTTNALSNKFVIQDTTAGENRLVIDTSGNVGIGTTSPSSQLHISNVNSAYLRLENQNDNYLLLGAVGGSNRIYSRTPANAAYPFSIEVGTDAVFNIDTSSRVGIGVTSPTNKLDVNGTVRGRGGFTSDNNAKEYYWHSNNTGNSGTIWRKIGTYNAAGQSSRIMITAVGTASYDGGQSSGKTTIIAQVNNNNLLEGSFWQEGMVAQYGAVGFISNSATSHDIYYQISSYSEFAFEALISDGTFTPDATTVSTPTFTRTATREWNVNDSLNVDSSGNVGIGTSSPKTGSKLTIQHDTTGGSLPTYNLPVIVDGQDMALGNGGGIKFGGVFTTGGTPNGDMAFIKSYKENATSGNYSYALTFGTRVNGGNPTERMRIDSSGKVGIGVTPSNTLHIYKNASMGSPASFTAANAGLRIQDNFNSMYFDGNAIISNTTGVFEVGTTESAPIALFTNATERMRIDDNGRLNVYRNGNRNGGTLLLGPNNSGTNKWSYLAGAHYNQASGSGNGSGSAGIALIGSYADIDENRVHIGGNPYELNAATSIHFNTHTSNTSTLGGTERMRIDSSGRVGIGTTSPVSNLEVQGAAPFITISDTTETECGILFRDLQAGYNQAAAIKFSSSDNKLRFYNNDTGSGALSITIDTAQNVGIGTDSPATKLHVVGNTTNNQLRIERIGTATGKWNIYTNFDQLYFQNAVDSAIPLMIASNDNVGIGTTTPSEKLDVQGDAIFGDYLKMGSSASYMGYIGFNRNTANGNIYNSSYGAYQLQNFQGELQLQVYNSAGTQQGIHRFSNNGNVSLFGKVGINNTSPSAMLEINAKTSTNCIKMTGIQYSQIGNITQPQFCGSLNWNAQFYPATAITWQYNSSTKGSIVINNNSTSYNTSSDYRLKENISEITDGIDRLKQLKPSRFNFIGDDQLVDGFIAHEAQEIVPEAVTGEKDGEEYQGIDQSKLVPLLTAALKEAVAKIEALEQRISNLENK